MAEYRRQTIIASAVAVMVALSIGFGVYFVQPQLSGGGGGGGGANTTTTETSYSSNLPMIAQVVNSTSGLDLVLSLNSSSINPGQGVSINVTEYNNRVSENNVSSENHWAISGLTFGGCGTLNYPMGIAIFWGNYNQNNLSSLASQTAIQFYHPGAFSCPVSFHVRNYKFEPASSNALLGIGSGLTNATGQVNTIGPYPMTAAVPASGNWTGGNAIGQGSVYHDFASGIYTVVGGNEWGDIVILHFVVVSSPIVEHSTTSAQASSASSTPESSNELVCVSTNYIVLGSETISVQNGTTHTSSTVLTSSSETTFTTTTSETQAVGYSTTTTSTNPPSSWIVTRCTFASDLGTSQPTITDSGAGTAMQRGDWQFTSATNGTIVTSGETLDLNSTLTYVGTQNATVKLTSPILVFKVLSYNGSVVYSWYPPQIIQSYNVTPGENFNQTVYISTQGWLPGVYTILIYPEIFPQSNMTLSFTVSK